MSTLGADCFQNILIPTFTLVVETVETTRENESEPQQQTAHMNTNMSKVKQSHQYSEQQQGDEEQEKFPRQHKKNYIL